MKSRVPLHERPRLFSRSRAVQEAILLRQLVPEQIFQHIQFSTSAFAVKEQNRANLVPFHANFVPGPSLGKNCSKTARLSFAV